MVDQVLSASINFRSPGVRPDDPERMERLARACLRAAYRGAYLSAIVRQRKTLLLTLVGGGVFGNPLSIILEEIAEAHAEWAEHPLSQLEAVRLCLYEKGSAEGVNAQLQALMRSL